MIIKTISRGFYCTASGVLASIPNLIEQLGRFRSGPESELAISQCFNANCLYCGRNNTKGTKTK